MADNNDNKTLGNGKDGSGSYQMRLGFGTIAMLISATGMGLVPLFSRWATRTDMFDGTAGFNAGDSIGALMAVGRMGMGVLFFLILLVATHKVHVFKKLKLTPAIALGGLMIGMSLACYVTSTLLTTVSNAVLFIYIGPVVCVLLARIFRKEPMSVLQWVCLAAVFVGMLFGEGLLGFGVGGQAFGFDFNLVPATPEFPQKGLGDAFGLASGFFYGASMFFNGYRKDADTTARGVWNFIFAVLGAGIITIVLNSLGANPAWRTGPSTCTSPRSTGSARCCCGSSAVPSPSAFCWWLAATCRLLTTALSPTGGSRRHLHRPCRVRRGADHQYDTWRHSHHWRWRDSVHQGHGRRSQAEARERDRREFGRSLGRGTPQSATALAADAPTLVAAEAEPVKITENLTHIATPLKYERAMTEDELAAAFSQHGLQGFPAELDIMERTEDHVQMMKLDEMLRFAKASGVSAVTFDVTYFPHADEAEVEYQLNHLARELGISAEVIRDVCSDEIREYLALDAERDANLPVHSIIECYVGGTSFAWYGMNDYPRLKRVILRKLAQGGQKAKHAFISRASKAQVELMEDY